MDIATTEHRYFTLVNKSFMREPRVWRSMTTKRSMRAITFSALMLIQVLAPITYAAPSSTPTVAIDTDVDLALLSGI